MEISRTAEDLWRVTLSQIETVFGRLEYLSSLRNGHTGIYEHWGFEQRFGAAQSNETLRLSHQNIFAEWVGFPLEKREVEAYLAGREEQVADIIAAWLRVNPFPTWVPAQTRPAERNLFLGDLDILLELLRRDFGVAAPDPDA
jgi:hypothetical protein